MNGGGRRKIIVLILLILLIFLYIFFPALSPAVDRIYMVRSAHLSAYSDDWDGLSEFRKALEEQEYNVSTIISNPLILKEVRHPENTLYICVGVEKGYDSLEKNELIDFVNMGGKVLIMDDYGRANTLSQKLGVTFTHHRVWSHDYVHNLSFIKINARLDSEYYTVLLNEPTTLKKEDYSHTLFLKPEVFLTTSKDSYEDTNDNGKIDIIEGNDNTGMLPLGISVESRGKKGEFVFISDSSICINDMWGRYDNANFMLSLVSSLVGIGGNVIFDESRHVQSEPIENSIYSLENIYFYILLEQDPILSLGIALIILDIFFLIYHFTKNPKRFRHKFDLTYEDAFVEHAPDRVEDVRKILLTRLKSHYNLYFPDSTMKIAYDPSKNREYNLSRRSDLGVLIKDPELVDFLLNPTRYRVPGRLNTIVMKIDALFQLESDAI